MQHARDDYNRMQDPEFKIPADEPVFLIRAQDAVSADVVRYWAARNEVMGGDQKLSKLARDHASAMDDWPIKKLATLAVGASTISSVPTNEQVAQLLRDCELAALTARNTLDRILGLVTVRDPVRDLIKEARAAADAADALHDLVLSLQIKHKVCYSGAAAQ